LAQIRPWFMPWQRPVHEELTAAAARRAGYGPEQARLLVKGAVDNDRGPGPLSTYRRHYDNAAQPTHFLRMREHRGPGADAAAVAAARAFVLETSLRAWELHRSGDAAGALFQAGKALHTVQDSYFHADRDFSDEAGRAHWGEIIHVRRFLGKGADHDAALDTGLDSQGLPSLAYREAEQAGFEYLQTLLAALPLAARDEVAGLLDEYMDEHFALRLDVRRP
jgi:hypothetical protein